MNDRDKKLLINEINNWRKSKLLPSAYCDFLINLYSAGENQSNSNLHSNDNMEKKSRIKKSFIYMLASLVLGLFAFVVVKFTALTPFTQIAILLFAATAMYIATMIYKKLGTNPTILLLLHNFASVSLAVCATYGIKILELQNQQLTLALVFLCVFVIWLIMGLWLQHVMVFVASLAGVTVIINQMVIMAVIQSDFIYAQFYWFPLAVITFWISYAINQNQKYYKKSIILLFFSVLFLFMPEIGLLVYGYTLEKLAYIAPIKGVLLMCLLYFASKNIYRSNSSKHTEA